MTWFKVCDTLWGHDKVEVAGLEAMGLWVLAGSKCGQQLSNGFITDASVLKVGGTPELAERLVEAGLWLKVPGGYLFHDWEDNNPTREQVQTRREADKERKRRVRADGAADSGRTVAGFPVGSGSSSQIKSTRPGFQAPSARTQPPKLTELCDHGRARSGCPFCAEEGVA